MLTRSEVKLRKIVQCSVDSVGCLPTNGGCSPSIRWYGGTWVMPSYEWMMGGTCKVIRGGQISYSSPGKERNQIRTRSNQIKIQIIYFFNLLASTPLQNNSTQYQKRLYRCIHTEAEASLRHRHRIYRKVTESPGCQHRKEEQPHCMHITTD